MQRGMEAISFEGEGLIVIADDPELDWTKRVLTNTKEFAISNGFMVQKMMPQMHSYHLDDAPGLQSCNLIVKSELGNRKDPNSSGITDAARLANFYGRDNRPRVRYVREKVRLDYGKAHDDEYHLDLLEPKDEENY
jgi:hypothetical protein